MTDRLLFALIARLARAVMARTTNDDVAQRCAAILHNTGD